MNNLTLLIQNIGKTNNTEELKQAVLGALYNFGAGDNDFNGDNGEDYLWVRAEGYESNRDYLLNKVSAYDDIDTMVYKYFDEWIDSDCYYENYDYSIIRNEANEIIAIALAYTIG